MILLIVFLISLMVVVFLEQGEVSLGGADLWAPSQLVAKPSAKKHLIEIHSWRSRMKHVEKNFRTISPFLYLVL